MPDTAINPNPNANATSAGDSPPLPLWGRAKKPQNCHICGKICRFKFYNVRCCEACKQFFRRTILRQTEFFCCANGQCDPRKKKCRGCRLDRCLKLGMNMNSIRAHRTERVERFIARMERRRKALENGDVDGKEMAVANESVDSGDKSNLARFAMPKNIATEFDSDTMKLAYFCRLVYAHKRIWEGYDAIGDIHLCKFQKIEEILDGPHNLLALHECFPSHPKMLTRAEVGQILGELDKMEHMSAHPRLRKGHAVFILLAIGILKAMPAFNTLSFGDKLLLARELYLAIGIFITAFYSAKMGATAVVGPSGVSLMGTINAKYGGEQRILNLTKKTYVQPLEGFQRIPMVAQEEFAILLAILCSNPSISGLSAHAKEVLYGEQVQYSRLLLHYNQMHLGGEEGARRYAECVHLIEGAFHGARSHELMTTYIEVFHSGRPLHADIYPQCLKAVIK